MFDLQDWITALKTSQQLIVVEGIKDKKALTYYGITNIITASNKPSYLITEEIANKTDECVLLLDLDKQGKKLFSILRHTLQKRGIKINNRYRNFLFSNTNLSHIEGLVRYLETK